MICKKECGPEFLETLLEIIPEPVLCTDLSGRYLACNNAFEKFTGKSKEDIIGSNICDIGPSEIAEVHSSVDAGFFDDQNKRVYECRIKQKDGSERNVALHKAMFTYNSGKVAGMIGTIRNMTVTSEAAAESMAYPGVPPEQKLLEQAKQNEKRLESIFRAAPVGIGVVVDRILKDANVRLSEMTGYSYDELTGSSARMLYPTQEEYEYVGREKYRQIKEKGTGTVETRWRKKDGTVIDVLLSSTPLDTSDLSRGVTFTALDITKRKHAEEELIDREEKFRSLYDNAPLSYQSLDENGCFIDINPTWLKTLGYEREEVIGRSFAEFLHADWKPRFEKNFPEFKRRGYVHDVQFKMRHKDGHYIFVSFEGCIGYHLDGSFRQTYCVFKDITDKVIAEEKLLRSEERLALAMEASSTGFWDIDLDGKRLYVSSAVCEMSGYGSGEISEDIGTSLDLLHPNDRETVLSIVQGSISSLEPFYMDFRIRHSCGEWMWVSMKGKVTEVDEKGIPHRLTGTMADITPRIKAEEALLYAKAAANESNRMKSEMVKNVTHELRTPLTAVIGFSDLLLNGNDTGLSESQKEYVGHIFKSGQNLLGIVNRMIDFANVERGSLDCLEGQPVDIREIISEVINLLSPNALKKSIKVSFILDPELDEVVADREKLKEILYNLVENAIKFTEDNGRIKVEVTGTYTAVRFSVSDTGIGIAEEKLDSIFEPFIQIDGSISRRYSGTGLGLALVKKLVEMHGGSICVESEIGKGSNFIFEIPIMNCE